MNIESVLKISTQLWLPLLTIVVVLSRGLFFFPLPQSVYYGYFMFLTVYIIICSKTYHVNICMLLLIVMAIVSILGNSIPEKFNPWLRLLIFILLTTPISSIISSDFSIKFRVLFYKYFMRIVAVIIILSFIGYLSQNGIFYHKKTGTFRGLMIYCMVLGPYAGIASIYLVTKYFQTGKNLFMAMGIIAVLTCFLSGSRGAIVALFGAIFYLLAIYCKNNLRKLLKIYMAIVVGIITFSPILLPYTEAVMEKQERNMKAGGTFSSRDALFDDRIAEFKNSPFIGSGYASVNEFVAPHTPVDFTKGIVEPGSSWLFILSSLGIFAFIAFCVLVIRPLLFFYRNGDESSFNYMMIGGSLLYFAIHMIIEGYILSAGSFMFLGAWLCIGVAQKDSIKYIENEEYSIL